jgi:DNA-binding response OmpR family regulator
MVDGSNANATSCVLIVEDEVLVRMFAVDVLEDAGFKVEQAASGKEALQKFAALKGTLAAVIIDLGLPDCSGDEVATEIRGQQASLPILIASGRSERELKERFANDAAIAVLGKPFTEPMLLEVLNRLGVHKAG